MRCAIPAVLLAALAAAAPLQAQAYDVQCGAAPQEAEDACVKAIDLFRYLAPQLGTAIAGGNAILGSSGTLGGFGHVSFGLRVNAVAGDLPRVSDVPLSLSGAQSTSFTTKSQLIPLPAADLALGIFSGFPVGLTNVGGLDLLVSASYLPEFEANQVSVRVPGGSLQLGFGARLGLMQESLLLPGVSLSLLRRDLPTVDVVGKTQSVLASSGEDSLTVTGFDVNTTSWRLTAGKSFMMFGIALGGGQDRYTYEADISATVHPTVGAPVTYSVTSIQAAELNGRDLRRLTRTSYFADVSLNLPFFRLVGEIGQVSGGDIPTFNTFSGKAADKSRIYGSVGARIGW
ncbi:hypothetical protein BH23GEM2_BH23GEM2_02710 [soil metagenome]